jgi:hypothetical protein
VKLPFLETTLRVAIAGDFLVVLHPRREGETLYPPDVVATGVRNGSRIKLSFGEGAPIWQQVAIENAVEKCVRKCWCGHVLAEHEGGNVAGMISCDECECTGFEEREERR